MHPPARLLPAFLILLAACSADPTRVLPLVPAEQGSLECARSLLDERGYDARVSPDDPTILDAERREGQLGTDARREIIRVRSVADAGNPSLRAAVWAVDYYPGFSSRPLAQHAVLTEPSEATVTDAREALRLCGRQRS